MLGGRCLPGDNTPFKILSGDVHLKDPYRSIEVLKENKLKEEKGEPPELYEGEKADGKLKIWDTVYFLKNGDKYYYLGYLIEHKNAEDEYTFTSGISGITNKHNDDYECFNDHIYSTPYGLARITDLPLLAGGKKSKKSNKKSKRKNARRKASTRRHRRR
jgi:hypothetical protein